MNSFNIDKKLSAIYSDSFFNKNKASRPVIGITGNYGEQTCKLGEGYYKKVVEAGGTPFIIPPTNNEEELLSILDHIDGLLLSGGADINPLFCGEEPSPKLGSINAERDSFELLLTRLAYHRQMPILGICRGIQTLAIALGGKIAQDLSEPDTKEAESQLLKHSQEADRSVPTHTVTINKDSNLYSSIYETEQIAVNSFHHQAVNDPGQHLWVVAQAKDGIVEAVESNEGKPVIGVQWHPECLKEEGKTVFTWLIGEAVLYRRVLDIHQKVFTLDSHCDTPMFFSQGVNFITRDEKLKVDLPKMTEGHLDATVMVSYLPQPKPGEKFQDIVPFKVEGPKAYADLIFDKIENIVDSNSDYIAIARNTNDLLLNKAANKKSILLGIENGLALEGNIKNLNHFQKRGVVYITLCHNGDNDICDSARGSQTHGGVSEFGAQVIRKMNELGIIVDLSHAAEKSFYDALEISKKPIICSHSSARALCNHPRNLTDDQMRALAQKGGVCQITLYNGFLKENGRATIYDAIDHLKHAIKLMGIDHVGLGTDFDGDGGICGLDDASELVLFTRQLLLNDYSLADIEKIWGGNFMRIMNEIQN